LNFSISYHPKIDEKTERVNQVLKDMLRACVLEFQGKGVDDLPLVEFHTTTLINPPLSWLLLQPCMEGSVERLCVGPT